MENNNIYAVIDTNVIVSALIVKQRQIQSYCYCKSGFARRNKASL